MVNLEQWLRSAFTVLLHCTACWHVTALHSLLARHCTVQPDGMSLHWQPVDMHCTAACWHVTVCTCWHVTALRSLLACDAYEHEQCCVVMQAQSCTPSRELCQTGC